MFDYVDLILFGSYNFKLISNGQPYCNGVSYCIGDLEINLTRQIFSNSAYRFIDLKSKKELVRFAVAIEYPPIEREELLMHLITTTQIYPQIKNTIIPYLRPSENGVKENGL